jgi:hypothetical protein
MKMKFKLIGIVFWAVFLLSCNKDDESKFTVVKETLTMGSGYANDVYYSLENGIVGTAPRANWEIAFHTNMFSSTILTNGGNGVQLYEYTKGPDTTVWNTVIDTTGLYKKNVLYNSDTTWNLSAFERNMLGHPDYGWGTYNMTNHDLIGTTLFIIKLPDGAFKKIMISRKYSNKNKYFIYYANVDGTQERKVLIDCSLYTAKSFIYFSLSANELVDREPETDKWDFLITKYIQMVPGSPGTFVPYPVVGVLSNTMRLTTMGVVSYTGVRTAKMTNADVNITDYTKANFKTNISVIGYDWKTPDMSTGKYTLQDSLVYFVQKPDDSVFKIVFTGFEGAATGSISFDKTKLK